jgi:hypothetical protein
MVGTAAAVRVVMSACGRFEVAKHSALGEMGNSIGTTKQANSAALRKFASCMKESNII